MLYRKSLRISSAARAEQGAGRIVNLQSNDAGEARAARRSLALAAELAHKFACK